MRLFTSAVVFTLASLCLAYPNPGVVTGRSPGHAISQSLPLTCFQPVAQAILRCMILPCAKIAAENISSSVRHLIVHILKLVNPHFLPVKLPEWVFPF